MRGGSRERRLPKAAFEKRFGGQACLKRQPVLKTEVPKERGFSQTTSNGDTKASPGKGKTNGAKRKCSGVRSIPGKPDNRAGAQKMGSYQSGQMGQTVNLLAYAFGGSNPSLPTKKSAGWSCTGPRSRSKGGEREGLTLIRCIFAEVAQLIEH